jgi:hypothetical protein
LKKLAIIFFALISGCASDIKTLEIPVAIPCPAPSIPAKSKLPISDLNINSKPSETFRAYVATVSILQGDINEYRVRLKGISSPTIN